jgi:hypothetical protein
VSNLSRIRRRRDHKGQPICHLVIPALSDDGYWTVNVRNSITGVYKTRLLHRLIALAWIPNPEDKPTVNHINGKKDDPSIQNLEWCTVAENNEHAWRTGLCTRQQPKIKPIKTPKLYTPKPAPKPKEKLVRVHLPRLQRHHIIPVLPPEYEQSEAGWEIYKADMKQAIQDELFHVEH